MAVSIHGNNGFITTNGTAAAPSLAAPDTDTGLYFGTNLIHASTSGTERLRITAEGRLGIGDNNPSVIVSIKDASPKIKFIDSDATGTPETLLDGSGGDLILDIDKDNEKSSTLFAVKIDGSEKLRIDSSGEIISYNGTLRRNVSDSSFTVSGDTASNTGANINLYGASHGSLANVFRVRTGSTERLRITAGGNVQINNDSGKFELGADQDISFYHTGTHGFLENDTGTFYIKSDTISLNKENGNNVMWTNGSEMRFYPSDYGFGGAVAGGTPAGKNVFLAIGDSDTGIVQDGDGQLEIWGNAVEVANFNAIDGYTSTKPITTTGAVQTGDLTILNGNPDLRLKDSNHGGNNTEHMIAFQDSSGNNQMNIGSPFGEQHLRIKHGTNDLVKIQTDGMVGIGDNPDSYLHIKKNATTTYAKVETSHSSSSYTGINLRSPTLNFQIWNQGPGNTSGYSGANSVVFWQSAATGHYSFYHGNDERFRITSGGQVHIGNKTNNANNNALFKAVADDGEADNLYVGQFVNLEATAGHSFGLNIQAGSSADDHGFRVRNRDNNANQLIVRGNGRVGIGENPVTKLGVTLAAQVADGSDDGADWGGDGIFQLNASGTAANNNEILLVGAHSGGEAQIASGIGFGRENTGNWGTYLSFKTHSTSTSNIDELNERLRIYASGEVKVMGGVFQVSNFQVREGGWNTSGWDTGISVNQGNAGAVLLCLHCRNWDANDSTASGMYLVRLGYNNNQNVQAWHVAGNDNWTHTKSSNNTLKFGCGSGNMRSVILWTT